MDALSKLSLFAIPFSVVISVCYLWGYWGTFYVDIFSYLTASDVAVLSVVPLLGAGVFSAIGIGIGSVLHQFQEKTEGTGNKKVLAIRHGLKFIDKVFMALIILALIFGGPHKWLILPTLFALLLTAVIFLSDFFEIKVALLRKQLIFVFVVTLLPFQAYGYGKFKALRIENGGNYRYILNDIGGVAVQEKKNLRYLGKAGSDIFIYDASNQEVIVLTRSSLNAMRVKVFDQYKDVRTKTELSGESKE